jgi:hypothetical protein
MTQSDDEKIVSKYVKYRREEMHVGAAPNICIKETLERRQLGWTVNVQIE